MLKKSKFISLALTISVIISCIFSSPVVAKRGDMNHGFKIISSKKIDDMKSAIIAYEHVNTGAKLVHMKNNDNQKLFSINFKTPPRDNTGVNHIIEHSVLGG